MSNDAAWTLALIIGLVAALIVAALLLLADPGRAATSRARVGGLLDVAGKVAGNTSNIPQLAGHRAGARADRRRGDRPGRLHERAHRRLRGAAA